MSRNVTVKATHTIDNLAIMQEVLCTNKETATNVSISEDNTLVYSGYDSNDGKTAEAALNRLHQLYTLEIMKIRALRMGLKVKSVDTSAENIQLVLEA